MTKEQAIYVEYVDSNEILARFFLLSKDGQKEKEITIDEYIKLAYNW